MPRKSFFEDLRKHYKTVECKAGRHDDCPLEIPPRDFGEHAHPCDCECLHRAPFITLAIKPEIAERISKRFGRALERLGNEPEE